jgi:glycosyltransferase involved in cell wall biosynthesis
LPVLAYIAYPTSLTLQSANALQTYTTLRELRLRRPDTLALIPRWGNEPSRFDDVGALHLPRPAIGKLSRLYRSTLLYYLEHSAFAAMTAAVLASQATPVRAVYVRQAILAAWWAGVYGPRLGIPVIYEAHDLESRNPSRAKEAWATGLLHLIDRTAIGRAAAVASLTEDFRRLLTQIGWRDAADVAVIPDAYDERIFAPYDRNASRARLGLPTDGQLISYAGMTFAHRWLDGLVAAVAALRRDRPQLRLLLVGGRPAERAALQQQAAGLGLRISEETATAADLYLLAPRPQAQVVDCLAAADVLAIPDTVTDVTASPLKLFEYLALGTPLVLPEMASLSEIVPQDLAPRFVRRDLAGLTAALAEALADDSTARRAARIAAARDHTYGRRAERILTLVDRVRRDAVR